MADRSDTLRKIRSMLDRADHPNTPPEEADTARRMADAMILRFQIEEFELDMARPSTERRKPELRTVEYGIYDAKDEDVRQKMSSMFWMLAQYCNVKLGWYGYSSSKVVGYPSDLDLLDLMFTRARLHLSNNLDPKADPELGWIENLARLKECGFKWEEIHKRLSAGRLTDYPYTGQPWERKIGVRFTKVYTDYCRTNGSGRMYDSPTVYRRSFVAGYVEGVRVRLSELQQQNRELRDTMAVVLANTEGDLMEALYEHFPAKRPHPPGCDCDTCHRCSNPNCKRWNCVDARRPVKVRHANLKEVAWSSSAQRAGQQVGKTIDLSRGGVSDNRKAIG